MGDWILRLQRKARAPFPLWDDMLAGVKAKKWESQKELAAAYHMPAKWTTQFKRVVLSQNVMTLAEWQMCFSGWKGNRACRGSHRGHTKREGKSEGTVCP